MQGNASRLDVPEEAVQYSFSGLGGGGTGLKDNYPVWDYGQVLPSHGGGDLRVLHILSKESPRSTEEWVVEARA
jgi:hypothetical protein